jgi:hypothetical protein
MGCRSHFREFFNVNHEPLLLDIFLYQPLDPIKSFDHLHMFCEHYRNLTFYPTPLPTMLLISLPSAWTSLACKLYNPPKLATSPSITASLQLSCCRISTRSWPSQPCWKEIIHSRPILLWYSTVVFVSKVIPPKAP